MLILRLRKRNLPDWAEILCTHVRLALCCLLELAVLVWGTIILAREYPTWNWEDTSTDQFCPKDALGLLFFVVAFNWAVPALLFSCSYLIFL